MNEVFQGFFFLAPVVQVRGGRGVLLHAYKIHSVLGHYCCMYIYHKSIDFKSVQHHSSKQMSLVSPVTSIKQYDQKISRENLLKFLNSNIFAFWVLIWFFFKSTTNCMWKCTTYIFAGTTQNQVNKFKRKLLQKAAKNTLKNWETFVIF